MSIFIAGCNLAAVATDRMAKSVTTGILNQDDPKTVRDGAPAYLLLISGLIQDNPKNTNLLIAGSRLYGSYAGVFVNDKKRARRLSDKSWLYSRRALCQRYAQACSLHELPYDKFVVLINRIRTSDVKLLYAYATSWAGWIQTHKGDVNAIANVPKVKYAMQRVVELDDDHDSGAAHMYLGFLSSLLPSSLGGKPERAKFHFERAIILSEGKNLMAKVIYAERYARLVFNRELHDRLLREVLVADPYATDLTLSNIIAKKKAKLLLENANEYF